MKRKKNQFQLDITTGEDIYFGKPEDRPLPEIGDECYILVDGVYRDAEVIDKTKCYFIAKCTEKGFEGLVSLPPGIPNEKFRPKYF